MTARLHIAIVNEGVPYPPTAGNRIRTLNLMTRLARRHKIVYICRGWGEAEEIAASQRILADLGIEMIIAEAAVAPRSGWRLHAALAGNLLSPLPYAVSSHNSPVMRVAIRDYAMHNRVDLWQFEWLAYADALRGLTDAPTIVDAHNVESLIWQRYYEAEPHPLRRWYIHAQWRKFERLERRIFTQATRVIAVSPDDAALMRQRFEAPRVEVIENGIDIASLDQVAGPRDPRMILFLGSLDWRPNLDAVDLLLGTIFPRVLQEQPEARLCIVGRRPPDSLRRRVLGIPYVELHADVADVRPFLGRAGVMAVPLRVGGGSRLKILEALGCGLPVVSTSIGAEGLCLTNGQDLFLADDLGQMAITLAQCIRDPAPALAVAQHAMRTVRQRYDWDVLADRLEQVWYACVGSAASSTPQRAWPASPSMAATL